MDGSFGLSSEQPQSSIKVSLHPRSMRRSIDKLRLKQEEQRLIEQKHYSSADHPAYVQSHCNRWANWWARQHPVLGGTSTRVLAQWRCLWARWIFRLGNTLSPSTLLTIISLWFCRDFSALNWLSTSHYSAR